MVDTLKDLAYKDGIDTSFAKSYTRIAHAIRMLAQCKWYEPFRKNRIKKLLIREIREIDNNSKDSIKW